MLGVNMKSLIAPLIFGLVSGCSPAAHYSQQIEGTLTEPDVPAIGREVRFVMAPASEAKVCAPVVASARTNSDGHFVIETEYQPSLQEQFAVLVQYHAICVESNGSWRPVWHFNTGPAMRRIKIKCNSVAGEFACDRV